MAQPINLPLGLWTRIGRRKHKFSHIRQMGANVPRWESTLAPPGEYNWTVRLWWRCGLMSNYCDHLLLFGYLIFFLLSTLFSDLVTL